MNIKKQNVLRVLAMIASVLMIISMFASCTDGNTENEEEELFYTVTFDSNGGQYIEPKRVKSGALCPEPPKITRDGYVFSGWYKESGAEWYFDITVVTEDVTLSAVWLSSNDIFKHTPTGDGETTVITGISKKTSTVNIPSYIGGYKVKAIGDGAFRNISNEEVQTIIVPNTVTEIGEEAFSGCKGIEIKIEGSLTNIGELAFYNCDKLKTVKLADGIEAISAEAFRESGLSVVRIPESVTLIDENAFDSCKNLKQVVLYANTDMTIESGAFVDTEIAVLYMYGTDAQIDDLLENRIADKNDSFFDEETKIYVYSETEPTRDSVFDGFWYLDKNNQIRAWK